MMDGAQGTSVSLVDLHAMSDLERAELLRSATDPSALLAGLTSQLSNLTLTDLTLATSLAPALIGLADSAAITSARVDARATASNAMSYANRFDRALLLLEEAREIAAAATDLKDQARVELAFVQPLARLGRFSDAVRCAEAAVRLYQSVDDLIMAAKGNSNLGVIHRMRGDAESAIRHFDLALSALRGDLAVEAQLESNRAEALLDLARFREAETSFRRAIDAFSETPHRRGLAIVEGNLADLLGRQGRLQASIRHFERAQRMMEDDEAPGDAARLGAERAEVLLSVGLIDEAVETFGQSLKVLDAHGFANEAARARTGLGLCQARLGQLEAAEATLQQAASDFAGIDARSGLADAHLALARVLLEQGRLDAAWALTDDVMNGDRGHVKRVEIAMLRARILLEQQEYSRALETVDAVLNTDDAGLRPLTQADLLYHRGRALLGDGMRDAAIAEIEASINEIERIRGTLLGDRLRTAWLGDQLAPYQHLLALALEENDARRVFEVIESIKSRTLLDVIRGGIELADQVVRVSRGDAGEAHLVRELTTLRTELNLTFDRLHGTQPDSEGREALARRSRLLERDIATLEGRIAATRRFGEIFGRPIDATGLCHALDSDVALLEYFVSNGQVGAVVVRDGQFIVHGSLLSEAAMHEMTERIAFQVDRGLAGASRSGVRAQRLVHHAQRELQELHQALIQPLEDHFDTASHLIVAPHGALFGVPFHAAFDGTSFLVERYPLSYTPSSSLLPTLQDAPQSRAGRTVVIGVADELAPEILEESLALAETLRDATLLLGADATLDAVREAVADAGLVHFATHGAFPSHDPFAARLRLGDQWMSVRDVYALELNGCAVTLSACEAGRSAVLAGDELFGLIRAFLAAGASSMITSLWAVHDESTRELMETMYRTQNAAGRASMLATAQRRLLEHRRHPAFWAPFFCIGGAS